jgi:hypothetical protein
MGIKEFKDRKARKDQEKKDRRSRERDEDRRRMFATTPSP